MNGVPGLMKGYRGERDFAVLRDVVGAVGVTEVEREAILGLNFYRLFTQVMR